MAERSKFYRLPQELREYIQRRWSEGDTTLDELLEFIHTRAPEADISRTGLGRHLQRFSETAKRIRQAREVAAGIMKEIGASDDSETGRLLAEMLSTLAMNTLEDASAKGADTKQLFFLSMVLKNLAAAKKTEIDRELKLRASIKAELEKKLDEKAREAQRGAAGGLSPDTVERAKELVRGLL